MSRSPLLTAFEKLDLESASNCESSSGNPSPEAPSFATKCTDYDSEHEDMAATQKESSLDESIHPSPLASQQEFIDAELLKKIDRLFECGVGNHVALPQLVVVGDQSSGKSSVLEGLTRLPFPRDSGLCTRFATQIIFRRHNVKSTSICLMPGPNASEAHKADLRQWSISNIKDLGQEEFTEAITEAQEVMGLTGSAGSASGPSATFSEDILRIEISGPEQQHLSIVDVPGIFRAVTEGVTTEADVQMVRNIVSRYMSNPRSVMLTVIPANQDVATQEILTMAKQVDPEGTRTVGILTKPDLVDMGSERGALDLLNGVKHKLALGWHVLRNPGQKQLTDTTANARDRTEKDFFETQEPWNEVLTENRGILELRQRLQDILTTRIRHEFPKVQNEINQRLKAAHRKLGNLGAKRTSSHEQRLYLTAVSTEFQRIKGYALSSQYTLPQFDECPPLRLPTYIRNRNDQFDSNMRQLGHLYSFETGSDAGAYNMGGLKDSLNELLNDVQASAPKTATPKKTFKVRKDANFPELYECTIDDECEVETEARPDIAKWLQQQHISSKGWELGSVNPTLLNTLFREQSLKWDGLAKGYISDVIEMVHAFITSLLTIVAPDPSVRSGIQSKLIDSLLAKYQAAFDQTKFLLAVERNGIAMTTNTAFADSLRSAARDRADDDSYASQRLNATPTRSSRGVSLDASGKEQEMLVQHLHDTLRAYYSVACHRFVDNVQIQAALHHLVLSPESPLELFSASFVSGLTDQELEQIAGEDLSLKRRRAALEKEVKDLEAGKAILC